MIFHFLFFALIPNLVSNMSFIYSYQTTETNISAFIDLSFLLTPQNMWDTQNHVTLMIMWLIKLKTPPDWSNSEFIDFRTFHVSPWHNNSIEYLSLSFFFSTIYSNRVKYDAIGLIIIEWCQKQLIALKL